MLSNILKNLVEEACREVYQTIELPKGVSDRFFDYSLNFIDYSWISHIKMGPIGLGSDFSDQDFPYTEEEIDELRGIYYIKNTEKLKNIAESLNNYFTNLGFSIRISSPEIEFGNDGMINFCIKIRIDGKLVKSDNGENYWVDYTGNIDRDQLVLNTPDVERYFNSIEEVESFIKNFTYNNNDPF